MMYLAQQLVTEAKRQVVQKGTAIDMPAGPSVRW